MKAKNIIIFLCLLACIIIVWQFILPLWDSIDFQKSRNSSLKEEVDKMEELINKLKELTLVYKQRQAEAERLEKFLPVGQNFGGILNYVEMMGAQAGIIVDSIDWAPKSEEESQTQKNITATTGQIGEIQAKNKTLSANISATGTYEAFKTFISNLENNIRLTEIKQIKLMPKGEGGSNIFDFDINAEMYYQ